MKQTRKHTLPAGWRWEALENLFTVDNTQIDSSNPLFSILPFIGMDNIESNTRRFISNENNGQNGDSTCFLFNDKHVLYGKLRPYLNKVYLPDKPGRCSMELLPLQPKDGFTREFIALILQSERVVAYTVRHSKGGRMPRANMDKLIKLKVAVPPDPSTRDAIAKELALKLAKIEKMRQAALRRKEAISAMQGAILREVFPWDEGDELPQGWAWNRLREVCFINPSRSKGFSREPNAPTTFVPMEAIDDLTGRIARRITRPYSEIAEGYTYFEEGDVLFAKITPCMENGRSAIAENLLDGVGFGSTEFHVLRARNNLTKEWVYHFIRTKEFKRRAEKKFNGSAGQQRVPTDFIKSSFIPFPTNPDEQIHITSELQHKLAEIVKISQYADRELEAIEALPGAILREVFDCGPESGVDDSDKEQVQQ